LLKTSIYIQIVIRWASIHRLSICIIDLPTTGEEDWQKDGQKKLQERQVDGRTSSTGCRQEQKDRLHGEEDWLQDGHDKLQERKEEW
jgi:hypothetical protein